MAVGAFSPWQLEIFYHGSWRFFTVEVGDFFSLANTHPVHCSLFTDHFFAKKNVSLQTEKHHNIHHATTERYCH